MSQFTIKPILLPLDQLLHTPTPLQDTATPLHLTHLTPPPHTTHHILPHPIQADTPITHLLRQLPQATIVKSRDKIE